MSETLPGDVVVTSSGDELWVTGIINGARLVRDVSEYGECGEAYIFDGDAELRYKGKSAN